MQEEIEIEETTAGEVETTTDQEETVDQVVDEVVEAAQSAASEEEAAPEWAPDFKYKVKDETFDMEDWTKDLIKDKETEEKLKVLFSKGHGIEDIKSDRASLRQENEELNTNFASTSEELGNMKQSLELISNFVKNDQMDLFFEALQIPEDKILKFAIERLKYRELPQEQRQQIDAQRNTEKRLQEAEWQNQQLTSQQEQAIIHQRVAQLDHALSDPNVVNVAQTFDTRAGREGAFKEQVIMMGNHYDATYGQDLSVQEAVKKTVEQYSGILGTNQATEPVANVTTPTQTPNQVAQAKPVIPNVRGRNTSPVRSSPTSIDDLRNLQQKMASNEAGL
jgi:hypothetical protein